MIVTPGAIMTLLPMRTSCHTSKDPPQFMAT
jgi:hypothetical protein